MSFNYQFKDNVRKDNIKEKVKVTNTSFGTKYYTQHYTDPVALNWS